MNKTKLRRIRRKIDNLRGNDVPSEKLESIAKSLGRVRTKKTWKSELIHGRRIVVIHSHGKTNITRFTAGSILDILEGDSYIIEEMLEDK